MTAVDSRHADDAATGSIRVEFDTGSAYLSSELPHQLRDADMRVLDSGRGNHTYRVPPGLYRVEAMSAGGERQSFVVSVVVAEAVEVRIDRRSTTPRRKSGEHPSVAATGPTMPGAPKPVPQLAPPTRARPRSPARPVEDGAMVCAVCGTISPASRTFCRQCGTLLEPVGSPRSRGWWPRRRRRRSSREKKLEPEPGVTSVPELSESSPSSEAASTGDTRGADGGLTGSPRPPRIGSLGWEHDSVGAVLRDTDVRLIAMTGCALESAQESRLLFRPDGDIDEPAHVTFEIAGRRAVMSLPICPQATFPLGGAVVTAVAAASGAIRLVAGFTDQRRVATVVDAMSGVGTLADSDSLLRDASSLLLHKYSDAPAAALGALMMQRLGQLDERENWVSNLATDSAWLPDGKALHASLLCDGDDSQRRIGLQLLLEAAAQRPLFTDGLSLMISLLRRWPGDERSEERRAALDTLGAYIVTADLDAVCLTVTTGNSGRPGDVSDAH